MRRATALLLPLGIALLGPGPLMAVHKYPLCIDLEIGEELYFATQREHLETLVEQEITPLRVFSGYSGWAASQLEAELEVGSWLVAEGTEEAVFGDPIDLWKNLARRVGENILFTALGIKEAPSEVELVSVSNGKFFLGSRSFMPGQGDDRPTQLSSYGMVRIP